MMKIRNYLLFVGILIISAFACYPELHMSIPSNSSTIEKNQVTTIPYQKDGIEAGYPEFVSGENQEKLNQWNQIIKSDFDKILSIYSFNPFPEPVPSPVAAAPTILKITYELKLNNSQYASIIYLAAFRNPYSAHPSDLVYTTNIDKEKDRRIKLPDILVLNQSFVKNFRTWDLVTEEGGNKEIIQGIKDYLANLSDEDLLMGMKAADQIGSGNLYGVFSYLTPDRIGISIGVPNYLGDHAEFEQEYSKLKDYIKPDFKLPK